jgi:integrase
MKRAPIEPSEKMNRAISKASKTGQLFRADGISIEPPTKKRATWRIRVAFQGGQIERSAKDTPGDVNAAFLEVHALLKAKQSGSIGVPENSGELLYTALRNYIDQGGKDFKWNGKTRKNREEDFSHLLRISKARQVTCAQMTASILRDYLNAATKTKTRADHLKKMLGTFLRWGHTAGFFSSQQVLLVAQIAWTPPAGSTYVAASTRREQSKYYYGSEDNAGGEIPTHQQVIDFANQCQIKYKHGAALIYVSANLGTRANETFILTSDRKVYEQGLGNYVDLKNRKVLVSWQFNETEPSVPKPTKTKTRRTTIIPFLENIATGFDVYQWMKTRSAEALKEQAEGKNPLALLFPNRFGKVHRLHSFTQVVIHPASIALGWKMPAYYDTSGKALHMYRFSLHSMRDRFGTTAADEWKYTERQLLAQGGWSDPETVRKFYLGTSDDTDGEVVALQSELAAMKRISSSNMSIVSTPEENFVEV